MKKWTKCLIILTLSLAACSPSWQAQKTIHVAQDVLEDVEPMIPEDAEGREIALTSTREALALGEVATDIWQRDERRGDAPEGYDQWIDLALQGFRSIVNVLEAAGVEVPDEVRWALLGLEAIL